MNHIYRVVFNGVLGVWVAVSELAKGKCKGSKKISKEFAFATLISCFSFFSSSTNAACDDTELPYFSTATEGVYGCYISGGLQDTDNDGKIDAIESGDSANYKNKNQSVTSNITFSLSNNIEWLPILNGPGTALPVKYVSASDLFKKDALTVTDKNGNVVSVLPEFDDWNLKALSGKTQVSWTKTDGTEGFADVYIIDNIQVKKNIDSATAFSAQIITAQPTEPFINLTMATIRDDTLNVVSDGVQDADGFAIDWSPGQVKQSSLFIADEEGIIDQAADTPMRVTFSYTDGVSNPANSTTSSGAFGPTKILSGSTITFQGTDYTIDSTEALKNYNNALIAAIQNNTLTASDYEKRFRQAFSDGAPEYYYSYDPTKLNYSDYYITPEMAAAIGKRAIFEAGNSAVVNLNANVAAIGQTWARAYNAWAHDAGIVNNHGEITVDNANTQNVLIDSGAQFTNTGEINFSVPGTNWADQVTGTDSVYINGSMGVISVSTSTKNNPDTLHPDIYYRRSRDIATEVLDGASAVNQGRYYIASSEPDGGLGTATGVHITNSGSFTNSNTMAIGKDTSGADVNLKGGSAAETLYVDDAYNAVSAYVNNSNNAVTIINDANGTININHSAQNSAAINIGENPVQAGVTGSMFVPENVTVENQGIINVDGKNSTGLKAAGAFTTTSNDNITNSGTITVTGAGSSGIFSASGAEITNDGIVEVNGNNGLGKRAYGIRADNATVTLRDNSNLTVRGSYTTGLYARTGGHIEVNGGTINAPLDTNASNQVVFWISGENAEGDSSAIEFSSPTDYTLENDASTLFRLDQKATYDGSGSNLRSVAVNGAGSNGYTIATKGTSFVSGGSTINVNGNNATGINVNSGAGTDGNVHLTNDTQITVTGIGATIATVDGNTYDLMGNKTGQDGAKLITEAQLSAAGSGGQVAENAVGYKVINNGELEMDGTINFSSAPDTTGVFIDGGTLTNNGAITSNGIGVDVYQTGQNMSAVNNAGNITAVDGTAAIRLNNKASLAVGGDGTVTGQGKADAIRVMSGADLTTNDAQIVVDGSGSGIHFLNTAVDAADSTFTLSGSGQIAVSGNDAAGITLEGQDNAGNPTMSNANMDTRGSEPLTINVDAQGGNGIVTNTSGYVYSGSRVNINSATGQSALLVKGTTTDINQTGTLTSSSTASAVVDLTQLDDPSSTVTFVNGGSILANGGAASVDATGHSGDVMLENTGTGNISGVVKLGDGSNTVNLKDNSQTTALNLGNGGNTVNIYGGTVNGILRSGSGNDAYVLRGVNPNNSEPAQSANAFAIIDGGSGADSLTVTDSGWYIMNDSSHIRNVETLNVTGNSTFEAQNSNLVLNDAGADANVVSVEKGSTYFVDFNNTPSDYLLTQKMKGAGTLRTDTNGLAFNFDNAVYTRDNFTGTLALGKGTLSVANDNTTALTHATLQLDDGGIAVLPQGQSTQVIGGLTFNSGTLFVSDGFIGSQEDTLQSHMQVTDLDVSGAGTLHLVANGFNNDYTPQARLEDLSRKSLLSQDEGSTLVTVVKASGDVVGNAADIAVNLTDASGHVLPDAEEQQQDIRQKGEKVAAGTYAIGGTTGNNDGLYVAYMLKQIDIVRGKTVNLQTSVGDIIPSLDLSAKLTGAGNVDINAYGDDLSLSNYHNDYTGMTTVRHGLFISGENNVLGQETRHTSALNLLGGTGIRLGETSQYVGQLNGEKNSIAALDSGTLNIDSGGRVSGGITSGAEASMNVNGGTLTVTRANPNYHGTTTIASPATAIIRHVAGLGDGEINLAGILNVIQAAPGNLTNAINGGGQVKILSGSDVNLTGDNHAFGGSFTIDAGSTLRASSAKNTGDVPALSRAVATFALLADSVAAIHNNGNLYLTNGQTETWTVNNLIDGSGNLHKSGTGTLNLSQSAAQYTGQTSLAQGALTAGDVTSPVAMATSALNIAPGATFGGYGSIAGDVNNQGTFNVGGLDKSSLQTATTYQVKGNFNNAGSIVLGSAEGTGSTLQIGGNYLANGGELHLNSVLNGGFGATETDMMQVAGNVSTGSGATRIYVRNMGGNGAFTQPDAIKIVDVKGQSDNKAFVLGRPAVVGVYEYFLNKGVNDNSWYLSSFNPVYPPDENKGETKLHYINPMTGAFAANQNALSLFNMTLHDRLGEPQYAENLRQDGDFAHSLWLRVVGSHQRYYAIDRQLRVSGHNSAVQLGHDIIHWADNSDWRGRIGIMGGAGNQQFTSKSRRTGSSARANIDSAYSVGLYGTLYQNGENLSGSWVDTWALYNWYNNRVGMSGYSDARYRSRGYNVSLETGHTFVFARTDDNHQQWQFIPQAQITYGELTSDAAGSDSGLFIDKTDSTSLESRLGTRLTYIGNLTQGRQIQPFGELNWRHQFHDNTLTFNKNYPFKNKQSQNRYEIKLGVEGKSSSNLNGWANVSYSAGDNNYREPKYMVGIKYQW